ncbi:three-Cys-motif partner protein TcmP [Candidatus Poribacteria bacterium]|nr:three-Cys-motif partner protein TcmP [Candidatus Poribacteria bacterium]
MEHTFGGSWTDEKLACLRRYLDAYNQALKNQPFRRIYIDAFAGTGYRTTTAENPEEFLSLEAFAEEESKAFIEGSASLALQVERPFDSYIFIERYRGRFEELKLLPERFPVLAPRMRVECADANELLPMLCCQTDWKRTRGVLFLDPYGMQVQWRTLEAVAATRAIDMWLLFPLGIAVNRLLTHDGSMPDSWKRRLDEILGTSEWGDAFYAADGQPDLFETGAQIRRRATMESIGQFFLDRLRSIFADVAEKPRCLYSARHHPLFLLCFAAANERGAPIAKRIAQHILDMPMGDLEV